MGRSDLPRDLVRARSRFQAWRELGTGGPIPPSLWKSAIRLASIHGVSRTAATLRLDYYTLRQRVHAAGRVQAAQAAGDEAQSSTPAFVEVATPPMVFGTQCRFELDKGAGVIRRMCLVGYDAAEIEMLARRFWNAE